MESLVQDHRAKKRIRMLRCSGSLCLAIILLNSGTIGLVSGFSSNSFAAGTSRGFLTRATEMFFTSNRAAAGSSLSSSPSSPTPLLDDLESFTVKELKQILKDNKLDQERGILTKLKLKQDLVDYLRKNLAALENEEESEEDYDDEDDDDDDDTHC
mmetsp:Transcript_23739/g.48726  ORF Transcript_23739/g.48726 Transcript_23739/m.48726 type:complete len:156 (-) Transcript_23739:962-1429(-)